MLQKPAHHGVAGLVIGHRLLLGGLQDLRLLLQTWTTTREQRGGDCIRVTSLEVGPSGGGVSQGLVRAPTSDDAVDGLLKVFAVDGGVQVSGGDQRRLVAHVGDVGP